MRSSRIRDRRSARSLSRPARARAEPARSGVNFASNGPPGAPRLHHRVERAVRPDARGRSDRAPLRCRRSGASWTAASGSMRTDADEVRHVVDREVGPVVAVREDVAPVVGVAARSTCAAPAASFGCSTRAPSCQKRPRASRRMRALARAALRGQGSGRTRGGRRASRLEHDLRSPSQAPRSLRLTHDRPGAAYERTSFQNILKLRYSEATATWRRDGMGAFVRALRAARASSCASARGRPAPRGRRDRRSRDEEPAAPRSSSSDVRRLRVPAAHQRVRLAASGCRSRSASTDLEEHARAIEELVQTRGPVERARARRSWRSKLPELAPRTPAAVARRPRARRSCTIGEDVDLDALPDPDVAGRRTADRSSRSRNVITRDPDTGARNVGMYRMQTHRPPHDRDALADPQDRRASLPPREGARASAGSRSRSRSAAIRRSRTRRPRRFPDGIDEWMFAGFLRKRAVEHGRRARRSTSRCRPTPTSCSRGTSIRARRSSTRGPSAITPATTRRSTASRAST